VRAGYEATLVGRMRPGHCPKRVVAVPSQSRSEVRNEQVCRNARPDTILGHHVALTDQIVVDLSYVLLSWEDYGPPLDPKLTQSARDAMRSYWDIRQDEGGPGAPNWEKWNR
jgi:hypothetical protein